MCKCIRQAGRHFGHFHSPDTRDRPILCECGIVIANLCHFLSLALAHPTARPLARSLFRCRACPPPTVICDGCDLTHVCICLHICHTINSTVHFTIFWRSYASARHLIQSSPTQPNPNQPSPARIRRFNTGTDFKIQQYEIFPAAVALFQII